MGLNRRFPRPVRDERTESARHRARSAFGRTRRAVQLQRRGLPPGEVGEAAGKAADALCVSGNHQWDWNPNRVEFQPHLQTAKPGAELKRVRSTTCPHSANGDDRSPQARGRFGFNAHAEPQARWSMSLLPELTVAGHQARPLRHRAAHHRRQRRRGVRLLLRGGRRVAVSSIFANISSSSV